MEKQKIDKSNWIAVIATVIVAVAFIIVEGFLGHKAICFVIGAILETFGTMIMITNYILSIVGVI